MHESVHTHVGYTKEIISAEPKVQTNKLVILPLPFILYIIK